MDLELEKAIAEQAPTYREPDETGHSEKHPRLDDEEERLRPKKKRKKSIKSVHWFLTWNGHTEDSINKLIALKELTKWAIQEETAESGTKHLQGLLTFRRSRSFTFLKRTLPEVHWEVCRSVEAAKRYCQKQETRTGKQWIKGYEIGTASQQSEVLDPLEGKTLYKYQAWILNIIAGEPDPRKIYWFFSQKGALGKSCLTKHMVLKHGAILIGGTFKDAYYAIAAMKTKPKIILFDIPRNQGNKVSYTAMEGIKNGIFFSQKYEASMVKMNTPHIIIFANEAPQLEGLSKDRWEIYCLDDQDDLQHIPVEPRVEIEYNKNFAL